MPENKRKKKSEDREKEKVWRRKNLTKKPLAMTLEPKEMFKMVYFTVSSSNLLQGSFHSPSAIRGGTSGLYSSQHLRFLKNVNLH